MLIRCMDCMDLYDDRFYVCPHCGSLRGKSAKIPNSLPPGTVLNDRYLIGDPCRNTRFIMHYIGYDPRMDRKCVIKEFCPEEYVFRDGSDLISLRLDKDQKRYLDGALSDFRESAEKLMLFQASPYVSRIYDYFPENGTYYQVMECLEYPRWTDLKQLLRKEIKMDPQKAARIILCSP